MAQLHQQLQECKEQSDQTMLDVQKQRAEERSELAAAQAEAAQVRVLEACVRSQSASQNLSSVNQLRLSRRVLLWWN